MPVRTETNPNSSCSNRFKFENIKENRQLDSKTKAHQSTKQQLQVALIDPFIVNQAIIHRALQPMSLLVCRSAQELWFIPHC